MPSLYDLFTGPPQTPQLESYGPAKYDIYDAPNVGLSPTPTPQTQTAMGGGAPSGWMAMLQQMAKQGGGSGAGMQPPTRPAMGSGQPMQSSAASRSGFISDSKGGFNLDDLIKVAAIVASAGVAAPAVAGIAGAAGGAGAAAAGGAGAAGGAAGGGGGGMLGGLLGGGGEGGGILGGLFGGGGGGKKSTGPTYAPLPPQAGPLVPQSAAQWQPPGYDPWMMR